MFIKGQGHIVIGKTTTTTTGIQIRIEGEGKGKVPASNPRKFPVSLPGRKPANGLPASGGKKPRVLAISSAPRGKAKK